MKRKRPPLWTIINRRWVSIHIRQCAVTCAYMYRREALYNSVTSDQSLKRSIPTFISFAGRLWQCVWSSAYHSRKFCVVRNATGTITYALSRGLEKEYAHANLFSSGSTLFSLLRAVRRGNSRCGEAMIKQGHSRTSDTASLIANFGLAREELWNSTTLQWSSWRETNRHFVQGLYCKTTKGRSSYTPGS